MSTNTAVMKTTEPTFPPYHSCTFDFLLKDKIVSRVRVHRASLVLLAAALTALLSAVALALATISATGLVLALAALRGSPR